MNTQEPITNLRLLAHFKANDNSLNWPFENNRERKDIKSLRLSEIWLDWKAEKHSIPISLLRTGIMHFSRFLVAVVAVGSVQALPEIEQRLVKRGPTIDLGYAIHEAAINVCLLPYPLTTTNHLVENWKILHLFRCTIWGSPCRESPIRCSHCTKRCRS